jgi:acyl transferase domain-containing protein
MYGFAMAGMTSPHGRSHTFDARADGYARSEACGAAAMKEGHGSNGFSVIGGAVRQDGRSASLTAPNGRAQQDLLRSAFADAGRVPADLTSAEAHGTGTSLGDPMEAGSLSAVMLKDLPDDAIFAVGSSKANVGHAETAAGMTGLLRIALTLERQTAMPNAQLRVLNPHVALLSARSIVSCPWSQCGSRRAWRARRPAT